VITLAGRDREAIQQAAVVDELDRAIDAIRSVT
jgi:hypothetical protein